jgi:hypothetical protein
MTSNISNLTKIAQLLDDKGYYNLSDKIENLIKTSQINLLPQLPGSYEPTGAPKTGNPLIDGLYEKMSDTAAGVAFAGGKMLDRTSPYASKYGPVGPAVLPTLTPAQFAEISKTQAGREYLAQLQLSSGLKTQEYMNLTNLGFISMGKFIAQNLAPGVAQERKQEFFNNVLPGTMATQLANLLARTPVNQWEPKLNDFFNSANSNPGYSNQIRKMMGSARKAALENLKYQDATYYNRIVADPKYKEFFDKNNV